MMILVNIIILIDYASYPWFPIPPLFFLTIPKQQYEKNQQEQITKKFSKWKQAHVGMEP